MFPRMWSQPPWRKFAVSSGTNRQGSSVAPPACSQPKNRRGTKPNTRIAASS